MWSRRVFYQMWSSGQSDILLILIDSYVWSSAQIFRLQKLTLDRETSARICCCWPTNLTIIVVSEYYIASCNCLQVATTLLHFLRAPCTRGWNLYVIRRIKLVEWWSTCCKSLVNNFNDKLIDLIYFICTLLVADHSARAYLTTNQVLMALPLLSMSSTLPTSTSKF